jgi:hypothetical protein
LKVADLIDFYEQEGAIVQLGKRMGEALAARNKQ